jgi:hypothetical protein
MLQNLYNAGPTEAPICSRNCQMLSYTRRPVLVLQ